MRNVTKDVRMPRTGTTRGIAATRGGISKWALALAVPLLAGACLPGDELETRTFELRYIEPHQAVALLDPYVYAEREDAAGMISPSATAVTVRELPANLDRIAAVLARFDRPSPAVRLDFMVIEADGFTGSDPAIAEVEAELRRLFNFDGYRLAAKASLQTLERGEIDQVLGPEYEIHGTIWDVNAGDDGGSMQMEIALEAIFAGNLFGTTVSIPMGQTVVLGSGQIPDPDGSVRAAILVVTPHLVESASRTER